MRACISVVAVRRCIAVAIYRSRSSRVVHVCASDCSSRSHMPLLQANGVSSDIDRGAPEGQARRAASELRKRSSPSVLLHVRPLSNHRSVRCRQRPGQVSIPRESTRRMNDRRLAATRQDKLRTGLLRRSSDDVKLLKRKANHHGEGRPAGCSTTLPTVLRLGLSRCIHFCD